MMHSISWKDKNNLELLETADGIIVSQNNESYLARNWHLTDQVIEVIQWAIESGLHWLVQNGHPKICNRYPHGNGENYISFSPVQKNLWVFVMDEQSPSSKHDRRDVRRVIFQKKYAPIFDQYRIKYKTESRNTKNLIVEKSEIREAIAVASHVAHDVGVIGGSRLMNGDYKGFIDEAHLQGRILKYWNVINFGRHLNLVCSEYRVQGGRIDILARDTLTHALIVIELKHQRAEENVVSEQIERYIHALKFTNDKCRFWGCLIAPEIPHNVQKAVYASPFPIIAFRPVWVDQGVLLQKIAGDWPNLGNVT